MRVALYTLSLDLMSGKEAVVLELVRRSGHDWRILTGRFDAASTFPELSELDIVDLRHPWLARHVTRQQGVVRDACMHLPFARLPLEGCDALYVVSAGLDHLAGISRPGIPRVAMCLTPLRLAYDLEMRAHYEAGRDFGPLKRAGARAFRAADARAWNRYRGIYCISETVRQRLLAPGGVDARRASVVYPGVDAVQVDPRWGVGDYFLVPGRINWTKRIERAVESYRRYQELRGAAALRLVIAGGVSVSDEDYLRTIRALVADDPQIQIVESATRAELQELYHGCRAVLFTAVNEDFGIVPLEAGAYGKPVVCVPGGGPSETVVDGQTGVFASDVEGFARALMRLDTDSTYALGLGRAARERALSFDWMHFAARTDERLESLLS